MNLSRNFLLSSIPDSFSKLIGSGPSRVNGWIFKVLECCVFILIYTSLRQTSIHFLDRF
ncbi:unnamed protein product [Brassica napus]|uniref:(rape) hypothetical protein n=1 Tax=Brassica napus TaxID=3708 RepID=A0A817BA40_BRANA|nr:unnamed protein product [Brassica napus]